MQELVAIEDNSSLEDIPEALVDLLGGFFCRGERCENNAGTIRKVAQGFTEVPALFLHQEAEDIAPLITGAKTAPGA